MTDLALVWHQLRARPVQSLIPMLVIGIAIATSIAVLALADAARRGIEQASDPFGVLVVGPKGDGQQLVLNSILLQGAPLGTIDRAIYNEIAAAGDVRLAIPLAQADSIGRAPIIGTTADFLQLRGGVNDPPAFAVNAGRWFEADFEAVLGARAAAGLGLRVGEQFQPAHGVGVTLASDQHPFTYTVVGVLGASGTAYDNAVYVSLGSVWATHEDEEADSAFSVVSGAADRLTAVLVQPLTFNDANRIWQRFYVRTDAQAVFPGQALGSLFDLLRQGEQILAAVGYLMLAIAALTVFLSMYGAALTRERDVAILRSLGAGRAHVFRLALLETLLVTIVGALIGRALGYGTAFALAGVLGGRSAIPLPIAYLINLEPTLWALSLIVGAAAGVLPAILAARVDIAAKLTPS